MAKGKLAGGLFSAGQGAAAVERVAAPKGKGPAPANERSVTTTFRLRPDHWEALRFAAMKKAGPGKRADASSVLEDVLAAWVKGKK